MEPQLATTLKHLFRGIMRVHRTKLPAEMRDLGDSYVRAEFRAHIKAKTTEAQWTQFLSMWEGYLAMLNPPAEASSQPVGLHVEQHAAVERDASSVGSVDAVRQVTEGLDTYMSPEQRLRLEALRKEAAQLGQAMLHGSGSQPGSNKEQ